MMILQLILWVILIFGGLYLILNYFMLLDLRQRSWKMKLLADEFNLTFETIVPEKTKLLPFPFKLDVMVYNRIIGNINAKQIDISDIGNIWTLTILKRTRILIDSKEVPDPAFLGITSSGFASIARLRNLLKDL